MGPLSVCIKRWAFCWAQASSTSQWMMHGAGLGQGLPTGRVGCGVAKMGDRKLPSKLLVVNAKAHGKPRVWGSLRY